MAVTAWQQTTPNVYQRQLGVIEKTYVTISSLGHPLDRDLWAVHITGTFQLASKQNAALAVRKAWQALRFDYPNLGTTLKSQTLSYNVVDADSLEEWTDKTFTVESDDVKTVDPIATSRAGSLPTCHLLHSKTDTPCVLLHIAHWRIDGVGAAHLLNRLFDHVAKPAPLPSFGSEVSRLSPPYDEIVKPPVTPTAEAQTRLGQEFNNLLSHSPSVGLPHNGTADTLPAASKDSPAFCFSPEATKAFTNAVNTRGLKLVAALHAALALYTWSVAPTGMKGRSYVSPTPVSLRQFLPEPYNGAEHAVALYLSGVQIIQQPGQSFTDLTKSIKEWYNSSQAPDWLPDCRERAIRFGKLLASADQRPAEWGLPSQTMLNNLSVMDRYVKPDREGLTVKDVKVGVEVLNAENVLYCWTWRGQLYMGMSYNEAFHKPEQVQACMEGVVKVLERELEVKLM